MSQKQVKNVTKTSKKCHNTSIKMSHKQKRLNYKNVTTTRTSEYKRHSNNENVAVTKNVTTKIILTMSKYYFIEEKVTKE